MYKGVVASGEYSAMVEELTSGPFLAAEVAPRSAAPADAVDALRELCGPADPEVGFLSGSVLRVLWGCLGADVEAGFPGSIVRVLWGVSRASPEVGLQGFDFRAISGC